jgi:putative Mg2+ transporter-C (MgtC) family protein
LPLHPSWADIALRLVLTMLAGGIIGLDRGVRGHVAGLRTTVLVGLAASVAMIQTNLLLGVEGKTAASFGVMDLMRLPLGILTGVGFIGGGTILRRGDLVTGVTTAATLWAVTVIGLCFGGGQIALGLVATLLAMTTLAAFEWVDRRIPREHRAILETRVQSPHQPPNDSVEHVLAPLGCSVRFLQQSAEEEPGRGVRLRYELRWKRAETSGPPTDIVAFVNDRLPVISLNLAEEG